MEMALLAGIDVGTSGCKVGIFSEDGKLISFSSREYPLNYPREGYAELNVNQVLQNVESCIKEAVLHVDRYEIKSLSVSSLGEAVVPIDKDGNILYSSILNFDIRGEEYLNRIRNFISEKEIYQINGNIFGNHYTMPKLMWIKEYEKQVYDRTYKFLPWTSFISYILGAEPYVDYSLANRTLLFDINKEEWSEKLLKIAGIEKEKLPSVVPAGTEIGKVSKDAEKRTGLPSGIPIIAGAHDQCCNAVGCGVIEEDIAMYGMGTYLCIVPNFKERISADFMLKNGFNTEHHSAKGKFVTLIYNLGGLLVRWYRDTFAQKEKSEKDIYYKLFSEIKMEGESDIFVIPYFTTIGVPYFLSNTKGIIFGLKLETERQDILKGIIEGSCFHMLECMEEFSKVRKINEYRVVGGGSKSDIWIKITCDIFGKTFKKPKISEAGCLGAAILAGAGCGIFSSFEEGVLSMVKIEKIFEPDLKKNQYYRKKFEKYKELKKIWEEIWKKFMTL